jgi:hypothetical protein
LIHAATREGILETERNKPSPLPEESMPEEERKSPAAVEGAETLHKLYEGTEIANHANQAMGLTPGAAVANTMEEMGGFGGHAIEGMRGPLNAVMETPLVQGLGGGLGVLLGGYNTAKGIDELTTEGERGQGALDTMAGVTGLAAGAAGIGTAVMGSAGLTAALGGASAACPFLAPAALAAGLIASGNETAKEWGMFGKGEDGKNRSGTDFIADETTGAYHWADDALGGGVLGTIGGGVAGAGAAIGSGVLGLGGDLIAGVGGLGESIGSGIGSAASAIMSW